MPHAADITFFHTDAVERQTVAAIARAAAEAGYVVRFSDDVRRPAEIGVYCQHRGCPEHAALSIVLLHDMAQRHDLWPDPWAAEPWSGYDAAIVPGDSWADRWLACSHAGAAPRIGVFKLGWPKADALFAADFAAGAQALRASLALRHDRAILYAPSWEFDGRQDELVRLTRDLPVDVLLKQAPWPETYPDVTAAIREMNARHRELAGNVHVVDPHADIMQCLAIADVIVSEESSVLVEALLLDVPPIAVLDWLIPDRVPPRPASVPYDFPIKTVRADLRATILDALARPAHYRRGLAAARARHFSHLGTSAASIVALIDALRRGQRDGLPGQVRRGCAA
jgi:hypothetical protein